MASKSKFEYNYAGFTVVEIAGHCEVGVRAGFVVFFGGNHPLNFIGPVSGPAVEYAAEIQAAIKAIEMAEAQGIQKLCIRDRSTFVRDAVLGSMPKWRRDNWSGCPPALLTDFRRLDTAIRRGKVMLQWREFEREKSPGELFHDEMLEIEMNLSCIDTVSEMAKIGAQNYL